MILSFFGISMLELFEDMMEEHWELALDWTFILKIYVLIKSIMVLYSFVISKAAVGLFRFFLLSTKCEWISFDRFSIKLDALL